MFRLPFALALFWLCPVTLLVAWSPVARAASEGYVGEISFAEGTAQRAGSDNSWAAANVATKVFQGDRLKTSRGSRLEVRLNDGSMLRISENTEFKLETAYFNPTNTAQKKVKARLVVGRLWAAVTRLFGRESEFEVSTGNAVAGVRGTRFETVVTPSGQTEVRVHGGDVLVGTNGGTAVAVGAMQQVQVSTAGNLSPAQTFTPNNGSSGANNGWEAWNTQRDKDAGFAETSPVARNAKLAQVSDKDKREGAQRAVERLKEVLTKTLKQMGSAREERDVLKVNCIGEKLTAVKALLRVAEQADVTLQEALARGDSEESLHAFEKLATAEGMSDKIAADTDACVGEVSQYAGETQVEVEEDADILLEYDPTTAVNGLPPPTSVVDRPPPTTNP